MSLFGRKRLPFDNEKATLARNLYKAEARYLETLRRELANLILRLDPDRLIRCYDDGWAYERQLIESSERATAEEAALGAKIRLFEDFDLLGTHHFVPYETRHFFSDDELVERYHEITHMLIFLKNRSEFEVERQRLLHNEKDYAVLLRCMREEKDRNLKRRIQAAMDRFNAYRAGYAEVDPGKWMINNFEDAEVCIQKLESFTDIQWGITFKKTDEHAIYSFFVHDDDRVTYSYARTDRNFKNPKYLMR